MPLIVCKDNKKVRKKKRSLCKITWTKRKSGKLKPYFIITFLNLESQTCSTNSFNPQQTKQFARARKRQTFRETTFAERGNAKPFGKWLSPTAEMPNLSGSDFRQPRKCQTFRETTFAKRGKAKPFGKRLSPSAETPNHSGNDFRQARKRQTF